MLVPQELLASVLFLGYGGEGEPADSTAFLVNVPEDEHANLYLVTAGHCVRDEVGLFARVNTPDGPPELVDLPDGKDWWYHPNTRDADVDLAVFPLGSLAVTAWYARGYRWVPMTMFFDEHLLGDDPNEGFGIGDELVSIGLFHVHVGHKRNLPMVRTGNLAMVPEEPVEPTDAFGKKGRPEWLYLIELRSIGGMSGSPVFARHHAPVGEPEVSVSLIGVLVGGWDTPRRRDQRDEVLNQGVGMVTPARTLREVLYQEGLIEMRKRALG